MNMLEIIRHEAKINPLYNKGILKYPVPETLATALTLNPKNIQTHIHTKEESAILFEHWRKMLDLESLRYHNEIVNKQSNNLEGFKMPLRFIIKTRGIEWYYQCINYHPGTKDPYYLKINGEIFYLFAYYKEEKDFKREKEPYCYFRIGTEWKNFYRVPA